MHVEYKNFSTREQRIAYVAERFKTYLNDSVLDVGCDQGFLKKYCQNIQYTGVDITNHADLEINLETITELPFKDAQFTSTICIDVLEHLDNLHAVFTEMLRVTNHHVIISWHNCWVNARRPIDKGEGNFSHYGLPLQRPQDRHKWFFNITQALEFVRGHEKILPYRVVELFAMEKPRPAFVHGLRRIRYPKQRCYLNRYAHTLWTVLEKV